MPLPRLCCLDPLIIPGEPKGNLEYFDKHEKQIKWYIARPSLLDEAKKDIAVVLFYDVFGFKLPNSKILADEYAEKLGVNVYVPNYLPRPPPIEPFLPITNLWPHQQALTGMTKYKRLFKTGWAYLQALPWLFGVLDWFAYPRAKQAIHELEKQYKHIGLIGYCRGGAIVIRLLSEQMQSVACGLINHPGPVNTREWNSINVPSSWHLADEDDFMKNDQIARLVELSEEKNGKGIVMDHKIHPETTHGFASRPNTDHPPSKAAFEEVKAGTVSFFGEHLFAAAK